MGHSDLRSEMDLIPAMTPPPVRKGSVRTEEHVGGLLHETSVSVFTFDSSTLSHFSPVLGQTSLTPLPNDCSQSATEVAGSPFVPQCQVSSQGLDSWIGSKHVTGFVASHPAPCLCQGCFCVILIHIRKMKREAFSSCVT